MKCVTYLSQVWSLILLHIFLSVIGIISGYCKLFSFFFQIMPSFLNVIRTCDSSFREVCKFWKSVLWMITTSKLISRASFDLQFVEFFVVCTSATRSADINCQATYQKLLGWNIWSDQGVFDWTITFHSKPSKGPAFNSVLKEDLDCALSVSYRLTKICVGVLTNAWCRRIGSR